MVHNILHFQGQSRAHVNTIVIESSLEMEICRIKNKNHSIAYLKQMREKKNIQ